MIMAGQKKILVLGGTKHMIEVVNAVKRMGMSPMVVDNIVNAPAKEFADESFNINAGDTERLAKIVEEEEVAGVYIVFEGINIWNAIALCKKAHLPFYTLGSHLSPMSDMETFKDICMRFHISIIEQAEFTVEFEEATHSLWEFPVLVKPMKNHWEKQGQLLQK
ncbi:hypothetical protein DHX103_03310 [Planococcus sp. X10-3]|uniref:hypothetical protein n=1 Tax=Planococcus sp. X10-3 TaxID=3061240 RepID=UPI003BAE15B9